MDRLNIRLEPGQKIFFTSDLHFGHRNILTFCQRPFKDVKEMDLKLIEYWNETVSSSDIVFVLGDFAWSDDNHSIQRILNKLNGQIYLIPGNHDTAKGFRELPEHVHLCSDIVTLFLSGFREDKPSFEQEIVLSHYPLATYSHKGRGALQFFGHIHSGPGCQNVVDIIGQDLHIEQDRQYDVGVDNNNYRPIELRDILGRTTLYGTHGPIQQ